MATANMKFAWQRTGEFKCHYKISNECFPCNEDYNFTGHQRLPHSLEGSTSFKS